MRQTASLTESMLPARCSLKLRKVAPSREDLAHGLRFFPVGTYLIFYKIGENGIIVARVLHGARDYRQEFQ